MATSSAFLAPVTSFPTLHAAPSPRQFGRRIGMLGTYPPKICGIATFTAALEHELRQSGDHVEIIGINDGDTPFAPSRSVVGELLHGSASSRRVVGATLSRFDLAIVQHEFGIYGGADGDELIDLMKLLRVPSIVVLHTVPRTPSINQRVVLESIATYADRLVVMTETAKARLHEEFDIDDAKVIVIPHGAALATPAVAEVVGDGFASRELLTWGLLGPGKGIEHVIDALALLRHDCPQASYTIAGVTHPKVLARDGDSYRRMLVDRALANGVADRVAFDDTYRDVATLTQFVASSEIVVLPYDSREQVTSGVLVDAIAAGRPVIATAFPHAEELLRSGAGIVVPHGDPAALAAAIRTLLTQPAQLNAASREAKRIAPTLGWESIAKCYQQVADDIVRPLATVAS